MRKYGKIILGTLKVPQNYPCSIEHNGKKIYNPTEEKYLEAGYLPIEETVPEEIEGKVAVASYKVNKSKTKIVESWIYVDEPECETKDMPEDGL